MTDIKERFRKKNLVQMGHTYLRFDLVASHCPCARVDTDDGEETWTTCSIRDGNHYRECAPGYCPLCQKQKPLTLNELQDACDEEYLDVIGNSVWLQEKNNNYLVAAVIDRNKRLELTIIWTASPDGPDWYKIEEYGRTWVAWRLKPTKEERESVRWVE